VGKGGRAHFESILLYKLNQGSREKPAKIMAGLLGRIGILLKTATEKDLGYHACYGRDDKDGTESNCHETGSNKCQFKG